MCMCVRVCVHSSYILRESYTVTTYVHIILNTQNLKRVTFNKSCTCILVSFPFSKIAQFVDC